MHFRNATPPRLRAYWSCLHNPLRLRAASFGVATVHCANKLAMVSSFAKGLVGDLGSFFLAGNSCLLSVGLEDGIVLSQDLE